MSPDVNEQELPASEREWDAQAYHRVSGPQLTWGVSVLARLELSGREVVIDVGCGTGRLTERLLDRLPGGRAIGVDRSGNMVRLARAFLAPRHGHHVAFVQADASSLPFRGIADAVFSTATFHWILDHDRLFVSLYAALKPGGRLVAQCGGGPNLKRVHDQCAALARAPEFAPYFSAWTEPWEFSRPETAAERLVRAGFAGVRTWLEPSPVFQPDAAAYRDFVEHVICRPHLASLPDAPARARYLDLLTEAAAGTSPPFVLDYWRLNLEARRP